MRIEILQEFKGIIGETEFERGSIYDVVQQLITNTDLKEKLEILSNEDADIFVRNAKKVFEMAEYCSLDVYNVLDDLRNDVEEEKKILGESLESFYWLNGRLTETQEFKKMNEIYKKTLEVELYWKTSIKILTKNELNRCHICNIVLMLLKIKEYEQRL